MSEEGGRLPLPPFGADKDGTGPLSGDASQGPPPANPIRGHTEHVRELWEPEGREIAGEIPEGAPHHPPLTSCSCPLSPSWV